MDCRHGMLRRQERINMIEIKKKVAAKVAELAEGVLSADEIALLLEYPPDSTMGDLALPCFKFAKLCTVSGRSSSSQVGISNFIMRMTKRYCPSLLAILTL